MLLGNINQSFSGKGTGQLRSMFLFHKPCWFQTLTFRNLWPYFYIMLPVFGCGNGMLVALVWSSSCVCIFLGLLLLAGSSSCVLSGALLHARMQITEEEREKNRCLGGSQATSAQKLLVSCAQSVFMEETISSTILFRYAEPGSLRMCYLRRVCADSPNVWPFIPSENRIYEGDGSKPEYLCPITRVSNNQDSTSLSVVLFNPWSMTNKSFLMNNFVLSKMLLFFFNFLLKPGSVTQTIRPSWTLPGWLLLHQPASGV